jgi:hypothetical protein
VPLLNKTYEAHRISEHGGTNIGNSLVATLTIALNLPYKGQVFFRMETAYLAELLSIALLILSSFAKTASAYDRLCPGVNSNRIREKYTNTMWLKISKVSGFMTVSWDLSTKHKIT